MNGAGRMSLVRAQEACYVDELREVGTVCEDWAGGVVSATEAGKWGNNAVAAWGIGGGGSVDATPGEFEELKAFSEARSIRPRLTVTTYASEKALKAIAAAGFVVEQIEHVFAARADSVERRAVPDGVTIDVLDRRDATEVDVVASLVHRAFASREPTEADLVIGRRPLVSAGVETLVARVDGEVVGMGATRWAHSVAYLTFAATDSSHRSKGIHSAVICERIRRAHERGYEWITLTGLAGQATERNAYRLGFELLYTRLSMAARPTGPAFS